MNRYRVFISYAHADRKLVKKIAKILTELDLVTLWDKDINPGKPFTAEIRDMITRAHLFVPIVTPNSLNRPWVHQEVGFAVALNIPILPISIDANPSEMIATIQAIKVKSDLSDLKRKFRSLDLEQLILPKPRKPLQLMEIATSPEKREELLLEYTNRVTDLGEYGKVRNQARFGVFSLPDSDVRDEIWQRRDGAVHRSDDHHQFQRNGRQLLERHARMAGCRLIIFPSTENYSPDGVVSFQTRIETILEFIRSMPTNKIEIVISRHAHDTNLVIVGDHFVAESMAYRRGVGYLQTIFNLHPSTVLQQVRRFDQLFEEIQAQERMTTNDIIGKIQYMLDEFIQQQNSNTNAQ